MARTALTAYAALGGYGTYSAAAADAAFAASDNANGNSVPSTGRELVLVYNTTGVAKTVTFTSVKDGLNRTGDITAYSVANNTLSIFGPFPVLGWKQTDGNLYIDSSAAITPGIVVVKLPSVS